MPPLLHPTFGCVDACVRVGVCAYMCMYVFLCVNDSSVTLLPNCIATLSST